MKQLITCQNFQKELMEATDNQYDYYFHSPLCLNNKFNDSDIIQDIIDENDLNDYHLLCCKLCKDSHKNTKSKVHSRDLCFYQVLNPKTVDHFIKNGYYLVTPGWIKRWSKYVKDEWQFSKEIAQMFFADSFTKVLLLDTQIYENIEYDLKEFCNFINKEYEILPVGLEYYKNYIALSTEAEVKKKKEVESNKIKNQLINFTMSVELIKNMSSFTSENQIIDSIFDILRMMFMPRKICYASYINNQYQTINCNEDYLEELSPFLENSSEIVFWLRNGKGFVTKLFYGEQLIGVLLLDDIYLSEYKEVYYNTFLSITNVISLALYNSRLYEEVLSVGKNYQEQKSYFEQLFKNSPEMILITDPNFIIQNTNMSFLEYFKTDTGITGKHVNDFLIKYTSTKIEEFVFKQHIKQKEIVQFTIKGKIIYMEVSSYSINVLDQTAGYYVVLDDVSERIKMQESLRNMAFHDSLTGLYNRAYCDVEMSRLSKTRQLPLGIIIGDVNGLKVTNDAFGHLAGDKILKQIALIIKESCREGDIISRWGGDEYVIILPNTNEEVIKKISNRILKRCKSFKDFDYVLPSISLGYSVLDSNQVTVTQVFNQAEKMMYENKLLQKTSIRSRIVNSLENSLYEKSYETEEHAKRVAEMCLEVANYLNFGDKQKDEMELFARLHDIGKLMIDNVLLEKVEPLTDSEFLTIKEHSETGYSIANSIPELAHVADFILNHHERWDGNGYPNRLQGDQIPIQSRILVIADSIDTMRSVRSYKSAFPEDRVLDELVRNKGTQFDPTLVEIFINLYFSKNA